MGNIFSCGFVIANGGCPKAMYLDDYCLDSSTVCNTSYENYFRNQCLTWFCTVLAFESVLKGGRHVQAPMHVSKR